MVNRIKSEKIPKKLIERMMKENGAKRISKEAKEKVREKLKEFFEKLTPIAIRNAQHYGRKLITKQDIEFALKYVLR